MAAPLQNNRGRRDYHTTARLSSLFFYFFEALFYRITFDYATTRGSMLIRFNYSYWRMFMVVKLKWTPGKGAHCTGISPEQAAFEKLLFKGLIKSFKVEFRDKNGILVSTQPIPLTPAGKAKIDLFS